MSIIVKSPSRTAKCRGNCGKLIEAGEKALSVRLVGDSGYICKACCELMPEMWLLADIKKLQD